MLQFPKPSKVKRGNTKRKITKETKEIVYERDGGKCIICNCNTMDEFHHIHFCGSAIYTDNRNDPDQIVLLCHNCHNKLHFEGDTWRREECKIYINKHYGKIQS